LDPYRRQAGEAGDPIAHHRGDDVPWQQVVHQRDPGADDEGRGELTQAVIEAERQHREEAIVGAVLEIAADAIRPGQHVPVRQHHPLRHAGRARGIKDRRHVAVDDPVRPARGRLAGGHEVRPAGEGDPVDGAEVGRRHPVIDDHHRPQVGAVRQHVDQAGEPRPGRHQDAHVAVLQDIGDLPRFQDRVQGHENAAGGRRAEQRDDRLEALLHVHADTLAAMQGVLEQAAGGRLDRPGQRSIGHAAAFVAQRGGVAPATRRREDQV
jgi:hypothetical protein